MVVSMVSIKIHECQCKSENCCNLEEYRHVR